MRHTAISRPSRTTPFTHAPTRQGFSWSRREEGTGVTVRNQLIMKNLFVLLSENGRLGETAGVIQGFNELAAKYKGELNVTVTSAAPLSEDVLNRLEATAHAEAKHKGNSTSRSYQLHLFPKTCPTVWKPRRMLKRSTRGTQGWSPQLHLFLKTCSTIWKPRRTLKRSTTGNSTSRPPQLHLFPKMCTTVWKPRPMLKRPQTTQQVKSLKPTNKVCHKCLS